MPVDLHIHPARGRVYSIRVYVTLLATPNFASIRVLAMPKEGGGAEGTTDD